MQTCSSRRGRWARRHQHACRLVSRRAGPATSSGPSSRRCIHSYATCCRPISPAQIQGSADQRRSNKPSPINGGPWDGDGYRAGRGGRDTAGPMTGDEEGGGPSRFSQQRGREDEAQRAVARLAGSLAKGDARRRDWQIHSFCGRSPTRLAKDGDRCPAR